MTRDDGVSPQVRRPALSAAAKDFLSKPCDMAELLLRISNMLALRRLHRYRYNKALSLEERVRERPQELAQAQTKALGRVALVADVFDALAHERRYQLAWRSADAIRELERQGGHQFDPAVMQAFLKLMQQ